MAHADGIGVGKGQAQGAVHRAVVFAHGVPFAADVLTGRLNQGKKVVYNPIF